MAIAVHDISKVFWSIEQGRKVKDWMTAAGRSLSQVAKVAGISKTQAHKLVTGQASDIDPRKAEAIAKYLGKDPGDILPYMRIELPGSDAD